MGNSAREGNEGADRMGDTELTGGEQEGYLRPEAGGDRGESENEVRTETLCETYERQPEI